MKIFASLHTVYIQHQYKSAQPVATSSSWHLNYAAALGLALIYNQKGHNITRIDCENDGYLDVATCMHINETKNKRSDLTKYVTKPQVPVVLAGFTLTPSFSLGQWGLVNQANNIWHYFPELEESQRPQTAEAAKQYISGVYAEKGEQGFINYLTSVNDATLFGFIKSRLVPCLRNHGNLCLNSEEFARARTDKTFFNLTTMTNKQGVNEIALRFGTQTVSTFAVTLDAVTGNLTSIMNSIVASMKAPVAQA